jgi:hypothetical protein
MIPPAKAVVHPTGWSERRKTVQMRMPIPAPII